MVCCGCCEELSLKSSVLKSHLLSSNHHAGKRRLDRKEVSEHDIAEALGPGHTTAKTMTTVTVTFTAMAKNAVISHTQIFVQLNKEKNGVYLLCVCLPFVTVSALCSPWTTQESPSRQFICCLSPAGLAQEPSCTIALAVQLRVAFPPVPGTSALYSCSTTFLGSTKGAGYVGERRVPPLENYGEEVS